jgi:fido (protein-threonine AMPylation protein)
VGVSAWSPIRGETPIDPSGLIDRQGIRNRSQLNAAEADNIAAAVIKYIRPDITSRVAPFDLSWALELHREMFGRVWEWAGRVRTGPLNIGVPAHLVETQLYDLFERLPYWRDMDLLEQAARLHHEAVRIHPFLNGNGRWSRMLANVRLLLHGRPPTEWPSGMDRDGEVRATYLAAVVEADKGDIRPLVELHRVYTVVDEENPSGPAAEG